MYNFTKINATKHLLNMARLTFFISVITISLSSVLLAADVRSQSLETAKVELSAGKTTLADLLGRMQSQTVFTFSYSESIGKMQVKHLADGQTTLAALFDLLGKQNRLKFTQMGDLIAISQLPVVPKPGRITGKVLDGKDGSLPGASVKVLETGQAIQADMNGTYTLSIQPGTYTLEVSYLSYQTQRITGVTVREAQSTPLNIVLKASTSALNEVVVTASYRKASVEGLYARQKNNAAMTDGISAEQIRATPDNNTAQVLKRISGLTVQDEKFVTVRGLSERYNNVTLNGASLPSTEPNRRNFAFDIIPSALIDNIVVNKTATPDQSAEFAGGLVQVTTRDIPDQNYMSLTVGTGYNTNSTGKPFYAYKLGKGAPFGFAGANRDWWTKGNFPTQRFRDVTAATDRQQMAEISKAIPNTYGMRDYGYRPVQNLQFSMGRRFELNHQKLLALTFAISNRHEETIADEARYFPSFFYYSDSLSRAYNYNSAIGGLAGLAFQTGNNKFTFKSLYNRRLSNSTYDYYGESWFSRPSFVRFTNNILLENSLWQHRLEGEHMLGDSRIRIDWAVDRNSIRRDQPDNRVSNQYELTNEDTYYTLADQLGYLGEGLTVFNAALKETKKNAGLNLTMPFKLFGLEHRLKGGYQFSQRDADSRSLGLRLLWNGSPGPQDGNAFNNATYGLKDYQLAQTELMAPGLLHYKVTSVEGTRSTDDYTGRQRVNAAYLMADLKLLPSVRLVGGLRVEDNRMRVQGTVYTISQGIPIDTVANYKNRDWLPSANLTWSLNSKMNVRAAWSKTLSRADMRERSTYRYYDPNERFTVNGAEGLRDTHIENIDLRWEFFPAAGEVFSVSLFYKKFKNPVELVTLAQGSGGLSNFYFNLLSSTNKGFEADFRKSMGFLGTDSGWPGRIFVSGNYTMMQSDVVYDLAAKLGLGTSTRKRPLMGLSPYSINGGLGYFGSRYGINLSYNRFGRRLVIAGGFPYQDQYENPRDVIDLQLNANFLKKRLEARLNLSDLLQQKVVIYQNISADQPMRDGKMQDVVPEEQFNSNVNNDPNGLGYNSKLDYTRHSVFKGRSISLNLTYNF